MPPVKPRVREDEVPGPEPVQMVPEFVFRQRGVQRRAGSHAGNGQKCGDQVRSAGESQGRDLTLPQARRG